MPCVAFQVRLKLHVNSQTEEDDNEFIETDSDQTDHNRSQNELIFEAKTAREIGQSPTDIVVLSRTNTSISLRWKINPCANAYILYPMLGNFYLFIAIYQGENINYIGIYVFLLVVIYFI